MSRPWKITIVVLMASTTALAWLLTRAARARRRAHMAFSAAHAEMRLAERDRALRDEHPTPPPPAQSGPPGAT